MVEVGSGYLQFLLDITSCNKRIRTTMKIRILYININSIAICVLSVCPRVYVFLMTSQEMTGLTGRHPNDLLINENIIDLMTKQLSTKFQGNLEENLEKSHKSYCSLTLSHENTKIAFFSENEQDYQYRLF